MENKTKIIVFIIVSAMFSCILSSIMGGSVFWFWENISTFLGFEEKETPSSGTGTTPSSGTGTTPSSGTRTTPSSSTGTTPSSSTGTSGTGISAKGCVQNWRYQQSTSSSNLSGPYTECTRENDTKDWCMLPAYVAGGQENVAWKYTSNENDPDCLTNWNFYDRNGNIVENGTNIPRTITWDSGSDNVGRWCPLRVYVTGGQENKAWKYC